jgi:hypothetical protein
MSRSLAEWIPAFAGMTAGVGAENEEGRAERRAAPKPARDPLGGSAGVLTGRGVVIPRAAPKPARRQPRDAAGAQPVHARAGGHGAAGFAPLGGA